MAVIDLSTIVPLEANAVEISVTVSPRYCAIEILRHADDDAPLLMHHGSSTIFGVPEGRQLVVRELRGVRWFRVRVVRWLP